MLVTLLLVVGATVGIGTPFLLSWEDKHQLAIAAKQKEEKNKNSLEPWLEDRRKRRQAPHRVWDKDFQILEAPHAAKRAREEAQARLTMRPKPMITGSVITTGKIHITNDPMSSTMLFEKGADVWDMRTGKSYKDGKEFKAERVDINDTPYAATPESEPRMLAYTAYIREAPTSESRALGMIQQGTSLNISGYKAGQRLETGEFASQIWFKISDGSAGGYVWSGLFAAKDTYRIPCLDEKKPDLEAVAQAIVTHIHKIKEAKEPYKSSNPDRAAFLAQFKRYNPNGHLMSDEDTERLIDMMGEKGIRPERYNEDDGFLPAGTERMNPVAKLKADFETKYGQTVDEVLDGPTPAEKIKEVKEKLKEIEKQAEDLRLDLMKRPKLAKYSKVAGAFESALIESMVAPLRDEEMESDYDQYIIDEENKAMEEAPYWETRGPIWGVADL